PAPYRPAGRTGLHPNQRRGYAASANVSSHLSLELAFKLGQDFKEVADQSVVGDLEDRRIGILVDGDDVAGILHAGQVLDGSGDAAGDIEIGSDHLAGLPDLQLVAGITGVHG